MLIYYSVKKKKIKYYLQSELQIGLIFVLGCV